MLARGVLCRLAADVPKTSTHDLPRLANLVRSSLLSRNALSLPAARALSRVYKAALSEYRRSYATTARATKPTARVKKDVKKAAAKKPVRKTAAKKPAKKSVAKKAKPKKKAAAKPKSKPRRKVLTPEAKKKAEIRELKATALRAPVLPQGINAWTVFASEALVGTNSIGASKQKLKDAGAKFKELTAAEKEHYNHLAREKAAANRAEFDAWIRSHTPEQIRLANIARLNLKRRIAAGEPVRIASRETRKLDDDRQVKRPITGYTRFVVERRTSGDFKGIPASESFKLIGNEWKALSASEKKKYDDEFTSEKIAYAREKQSTYGHT